MKPILSILATLVALTAALPGDYGSSSTTATTTYGSSTKCTPTTYYITSTGYTEKPGTICTTETSAITLYGTNYKTSDIYATSTYVTTEYKTVETKVPIVKTVTKPVVITTYAYETVTDYTTVKTASPCPTTITSVYHSSSVIPYPYSSTKYDYYTKTITTSTKAYYTTTVASTSNVCTATKSGGY